MPVRSDPSLWFNLPGVVAAYQPVRAPGPLLARYNQAHGGDNRYRAELAAGALPVWSAVEGWYFPGTTSELSIGLYAYSDWSLLVRYTGVSPVAFNDTILHCGNSLPRLSAGGSWGTSTSQINRWGNGYLIWTVADSTQGVVAAVGADGYKNGVAGGTSFGTWTIGTPSAVALSYNLAARTVKIQAGLVCSRILSPAEVWHASRQMQYCDVNPAWSAWGRRRQWYYGPQVAATIYARRIAEAARVGSRGVAE